MSEISYPFRDLPAADGAVEVAPRVFWLRLALPWALDHVNGYALDDGGSWTLIDPGLYTEASVAQWRGLLAGPLAGKPVARVVVTHHHADHIGMAGWFQAQGASLWMTRTAWLLARMTQLDRFEHPPQETQDFWRRAGMPEEEIVRRRALRPTHFGDHTAPLPLGFNRLAEGDLFHAGGRAWRVRLGSGHAPDHATFWSDDVVIGGDQMLPMISPNIGVLPSEPEANPLLEWLESARRLGVFAQKDQLVLPGHNRPFKGLPARLEAMLAKHEAALLRLRAHLTQPRRGVECFVALFRRDIGPDNYLLALAESLAHLNYLHQRGEINRVINAQGQYLWSAA